ncbi:hypothetical protein GmHk_07G018171 [Glycine max]|nr:hypothetical protein GmHk_07G018171 [Glycine max]
MNNPNPNICVFLPTRRPESSTLTLELLHKLKRFFVDDSLATRDNLGRRNINVNQDDLLCPFCRQCYETQDHLFLSCEVTRKAWSACYLWLSPDFVTVASNNLIRDIAGNIWI